MSLTTFHQPNRQGTSKDLSYKHQGVQALLFIANSIVSQIGTASQERGDSICVRQSNVQGSYLVRLRRVHVRGRGHIPQNHFRCYFHPIVWVYDKYNRLLIRTMDYPSMIFAQDLRYRRHHPPIELACGVFWVLM